MSAQLRLYPAVEDFEDTEAQPPQVRVPLGELLPLLALAQRRNYVWLQDFLEDEVTITPDLYEILRSFRYSRPPAA